MNWKTVIRVLLIALFFALPALAGFAMGRKSPVAQAPAAAVEAVEEKPVSTVEVQVIENGHPARVQQVKVEHQSIPESGLFILAPLGWLLLLRRQK